MSDQTVKEKAKSRLERLGLIDREKKPVMRSTLVLLSSTATGALVGGIMGRPSLITGIVTTALGSVIKVPILAHLGMGMAVGGGYTWISGLNGQPVSGVKERFQAMGEDFKYRLYLDKILPPKESEPAVSGLGKVQYFKYPLRGLGELDMSAIDKIQKDLAQSAVQYHQKQGQMNGIYNPDKIF